jgi:acyl-CoA thioester hydrolase
LCEHGFAHAVRIYYEDTDAEGVVYYANYLKFMERARSEWLRARHWSVNRLADEWGIVFAVRSVQVDYLSPARLGEDLLVSVEPANIGRVTLTLHQRVCRETETLCAGDIKLASLSRDNFKPRPLPELFLQQLR